MGLIKNAIYCLLGGSLYCYFWYAPVAEVAPLITNYITFLIYFLASSIVIIGGGLFATIFAPNGIVKQIVYRGLGSVIISIPLILAMRYELSFYIAPVYVFDLTAKVIILFSVFLFALLVIEYLSFAFQAFSLQQMHYVKTRRKASELRLEALKDQLSPHYLFNSLNTVAYLVVSDASQAEKYIRSIAQTYQYVMKYANKPLITLANEIELVRAFAFQLHTRHGESVQISFAANLKNVMGSLPPLSIQMLVENAVKHNVLSDEKPVEIKVFYNEEQHSIDVKNNKTQTPRKRASTKVGLENIKDRYFLMGQKNIQINQNDLSYSVQLPLLS
ncbi:sensor histidine kinase [Flammeovirga kamogawensis]|uniref:Histidine kinase n=1 Tax=Flammeovirga kamogawensis TaxID=373891 RepID=A0ABX8H165_9BACT|nr:histidine kinase [Flammeovirga kamogawensis]MBB6463284.1 sensor histidine kinase YesM [Flammeovirga kamogawensis]QWG09566.1 histidine kinase [Flammeovirga kamogawensis]TRX65080.1 hypothetical protein EO216_21340 [Flammeovirga kamogawensis]